MRKYPPRNICSFQGDEILFILYKEWDELGTDLATDVCQTDKHALKKVGSFLVYIEENELHPIVTECIPNDKIVESIVKLYSLISGSKRRIEYTLKIYHAKYIALNGFRK